MQIKTQFLPNAEKIYNGKFYATAGSAGFDLKYIGKTIIIEAGANKLVPTGIKMAIPEGYFLAIYPRSGNSLKHKITLSNAVGVVDSDFRGEINAIIHNLGDKPFEIQEGDRIAQAILHKYEKIRFDFVNELDETERGEGGFGSTGVK
jgi:dUTP pyrophosphatase